jgi:hypothetical protein
MLSMLAIDEHQALELYSKRTGLQVSTRAAPPRIRRSRFYETVPPEVARQHTAGGP